MPRKTAPNPAKSDPNLLPLTQAIPALAEYGVSIEYGALWRQCVAGKIPAIRSRNRVYLVGQPADIAKLLAHELEKADKYRPKAA